MGAGFLRGLSTGFSYALGQSEPQGGHETVSQAGLGDKHRKSSDDRERLPPAEKKYLNTSSGFNVAAC
jgi:hypothetical protein